MASPILAIVEVAENQNDRYLTINAAIDNLEGAVAAVHVDSSPVSNDVALTHDQFFYHKAFKVSGASAAFTLTTLGENSEATPTEKIFVVWNADSTYTLTVQSDDTGTTVDIEPGDKALLMQLGDNVTQIVGTPPTVTVPYDIAFYNGGVLTSSQVIAHIEFARACTIPDDFAGSQCYVGTLPSDGDWIFTISKNGSSVGTLTITTGGTITFATTGGTVSMAAGDRLTIAGPGTADSTGADIGITIASTVD